MILALATADAEAGPCELADVCETPDPVRLCQAASDCFEEWFFCVQQCPLMVPRPQVPACVDECGAALLECGIAAYPEGAECYPCLLEPALCIDRPDLPLSPLREGWEAASLGTYIPSAGDATTLLAADAGIWLVEDTSADLDCGAVPQRADVLAERGGKVLRLTSTETQSGCADNVGVALHPTLELLGNGFLIPLEANTQISFRETGALIDPEGSHNLCLAPPCGDTVNLRVTDSRGNVLAYLFQRAPDAEPNTLTPTYREIFLHPTQGSPPRNLFTDFSTIPNFEPTPPNGLWIESVVFEVHEHGTATLDDLCIDTGGCGPVVVPEPSGWIVQLGAGIAVFGLGAGRARRSRR